MAKRIIDYYNLFVGAFVTIAAAILGEHWYLFAAFLALNVVDWLTGWYKAKVDYSADNVYKEEAYQAYLGLTHCF